MERRPDRAIEAEMEPGERSMRARLYWAIMMLGYIGLGAIAIVFFSTGHW